MKYSFTPESISKFDLDASIVNHRSLNEPSVCNALVCGCVRTANLASQMPLSDPWPFSAIEHLEHTRSNKVDSIYLASLGRWMLILERLMIHILEHHWKRRSFFRLAAEFEAQDNCDVCTKGGTLAMNFEMAHTPTLGYLSFQITNHLFLLSS